MIVAKTSQSCIAGFVIVVVVVNYHSSMFSQKLSVLYLGSIQRKLCVANRSVIEKEAISDCNSELMPTPNPHAQGKGISYLFPESSLPNL